MAKIAYQIDGQDKWKSFDSSQTMYILKGTKAKFWTETRNASARWKTFDTTGRVTVPVSVSAGADLPVEVIVFSLTPMLTFLDNFPGRSVTDVGVCEELRLM